MVDHFNWFSLHQSGSVALNAVHNSNLLGLNPWHIVWILNILYESALPFKNGELLDAKLLSQKGLKYLIYIY